MHRGLAMKSTFWRAVKSTTVTGHENIVAEMKALDSEVADQFEGIGVMKFYHAFIDEWSKCDVIDNNIYECFNNFILLARSKLIIDMLEDIRVTMMSRIVEKRDKYLASTDEICPRVRNVLEENKLGFRFCDPTHGGDFNFKAREGDHADNASQVGQNMSNPVIIDHTMV
ncbi:hypothetical protein CRG98_014981 [Punica granatum]|uniref:Uncharacterized protein n=1 Tax=Punica granatum TaxID=22663 RepID=A0A2I0K7L7_PUNGR|nr:hypothetical protein CRG98_014981 [Punica granatum]